MRKGDEKNFDAIVFVCTVNLVVVPAPGERAEVQGIDCQFVENMRLLLLGQGRIVLLLNREESTKLPFSIRYEMPDE